MRNYMKKMILALLGLAFAFAVSSCGDQGKKCNQNKKNSEKIEKHHDRW